MNGLTPISHSKLGVHNRDFQLLIEIFEISTNKKNGHVNEMLGMARKSLNNAALSDIHRIGMVFFFFYVLFGFFSLIIN